jgi:hypothetical protein
MNMTNFTDFIIVTVVTLSLFFLLWRTMAWQRKTDEKTCRLFRNQRTVVNYCKRNKEHNEIIESLCNKLLNEIKELKELKTEK